MKHSERLLAELRQEAIATRKILERVPFHQLDYKPHEKSMSLDRLATHVAEIYGWWKECLVNDVLDFAVGDFTPRICQSSEELLGLFEDLLQKGEVILTEVDETEFEKMWTMRQGDIVFFTLPKHEVVRTWCMNHLYHHRAQLGVYLRLLDVALPSVYGPSADEQG
jgi:uncharacterized damage-inducible protein DinB